MAIKFKTLTYIYSKNLPYAYKALDNVNLEIRQGVITAIIGKTGSGKSTLVEHLNALLTPDEGEIEVLDYTLTPKTKSNILKPLRKDVGLVFQFSEYQLFSETVLQDVAFGPQNFGLSLEESTKKAKEALSLVGLDETIYDVSPLELSGGQKRRVAIAGIIACDPKIIVLDEPTAGLDPMGAKEMIELFVSLNTKLGKTIIIVTHDNEMVYNYCDDTVIVEDGKIAYSGSTVDLFNDDKLLSEHDILKPQIVSLINSLRNKGFVIDKSSRDIKSVVKDVCKGIKK